MNISSSTWHYKVFEWWAKAKYGYVPYRVEEEGYNLCPYVRAVMFWGPLRFLFTDTWQKLVMTLAAIVAMLTGLIYHLAGIKGLQRELAAFVFVFVLAAFIATIIGIIWSLAKFEQYLRSKNVKVGVPEVVSSFAEVLVDYAKAIHDGICPKIKFVKTEK